MKGNHHFATRLLLLFFICWSGLSVAQLEYKSEEELKKAANEFFVTRQWDEAKPLYAQLLANYSKDPRYNYRFGACVLYVDKNLEEAQKFLRIACRRPNVEPDAFFFLAQASHLSYQFNDAIRNYEKFLQKADKPPEDLDARRQIQMCKNGITLLGDIKDIAVVGKQSIGDKDFFRVYDLKGIGGKVVVKPDDFKTKLDKKKGETSIMYIPKNPDVVYFSSYGSKGSSGKDIFYARKLPSGEWGTPQRLPSEINTKFDEDYPFMHPDGKTLYFCSKGHNSMGGYDVFKSIYDENSGKWSRPTNLDFAFSSPDDDILFISDADNTFAYFASKRTTGHGKISVYKVKVAQRPANYSVIKGDFIAEARPDLKDAMIKVIHEGSGEVLGEFKTNSDDGNYVLSFPGNGGRFKITVETTEDAPVHSGVVELPMLTEFRPLKQELRLVGSGDAEKLVIKNMFDEALASNSDRMELMRDLIKKQSALDINSTESEALASEIANKDSVNLSVSDYQYKNMSNEELLASGEGQAKKLEDDTRLLKQEMNYTYNQAAEKSKEASKEFAEYDRLMATIKDGMSDEDKLEIEQEALDHKKKGGQLAAEATMANNLARSIESEHTERSLDAKNARTLVNAMKNSLAAGKRDEAIKFYNELQQRLEEIRLAESAVEQEKQLALDKATADRTKADKAYEYLDGLKERETGLRNKQRRLQLELEQAKKKKDIERIQEELNSVQIDLEDIQLDVERAEANAIDLKKKSQTSEGENRYTEDLFQEIAQNAPGYTGSISEGDKQNLIRQLDYYERNELVGSFDETLASEFRLDDSKYGLREYNISRKKQLDDLAAINDPEELASKRLDINKKWLNDIDNDIAAKQAALNDATSLEEKAKLQEEINVLKGQRDDKADEVAANEQALADQLASNETSGGNENSGGNESTGGNETASNEGNETTGGNETGNENESTGGNETASNEGNENTGGNETGSEGNVSPEVTNFIANTETKYNGQLSGTSGISDPTEKAQSEAAIYKEWSEKLKEEALVKKLEMIEAQDQNDREILKSEIAVLEQEAGEKEALGDNLIAQYGAPDENTASNATMSKQQRIQQKVDELPVIAAVENGVVKDYDSEYEALLTDANNEADSETKETLLNHIYENWATTKQQEIDYRKSNLDGMKKKERKKEEELIANLETDQNEKRTQAGNYTDQLASGGNESTASNSNSPIVDDKGNIRDYGSDYENKIEAADNIASDLEKNETKGDIAYQWYKDIQEEINLRNGQLGNYSGSRRLKEEEKIEDLKGQAEAKLSEANYYQGIAAQIKKRENQNLANADENTGSSTDSYTSPEAKGKIEELGRVDNEITALEFQVDEKKKALNAAETVEDRANIQDEIAGLESQIEQKELDKKQLISEANTAELNKNNPIVNALATNSNEDNNDVAIANLLVNESKFYQGEAKKLRTEAGETEDVGKKNRLLADANEKEQQALSKQRQALKTYIKAGGPELAGKIERGELDGLAVGEGSTLANTESTGGNETTTSGGNETTTTGGNETASNEGNETTGGNESTGGNETASNEGNENTGGNETSGGNEIASNEGNETTGGNEASGGNETVSNEGTETTGGNETSGGNETASNEGNETTGGNETSGGNETITNEGNEGAGVSTASLEDIMKTADGSTEVPYNDPSEFLEYKGDLLTAQATDLQSQAAAKRTQAESGKKKERKALILEAEQLEAEAARLIKDAEVVYDQADSAQVVEAQLASASETDVNDPELSSGEQQTLASMGDQEVQNVKNSIDYNEYKFNQQKKRRIIKEADVLYDRKEEIKGEKKQQETILNELNQLAANPDLSDKQKDELNDQIAAVEKRITALDNAYATAEVTSAQKQDELAAINEKLDKITGRLSDNLADQIVAVEKRDFINGDNQVSGYSGNQNTGGNETTTSGGNETTTTGGNETASNEGNEATGGNESTGGNETASNEGNETTGGNETSGGNETVSNEGAETTGGNEISGGNETASNEGNETTGGNENTGGNETSVGNTTSQPDLNSDGLPTVLLGDFFVLGSRGSSTYSAGNPMKVNPRMPDGVIWSVQVGAFRRPISQDVFKGFSPVFANTKGDGITRYTAGLFPEFDAADRAKDQIRRLGYRDAFVVAYRNGKRISVAEARSASSGTLASNGGNETTGGNETAGNEGNETSGGNETTTSEGNETSGGNESTGGNAFAGNLPTEDDGSTPVDRITGVFFTVQVGVYSRPARSSAFGGLRPLNRETTSGGLFRYTYGRYENLDEARRAKQRAIDSGVADAFIVAYSNGSRVPVSSAVASLGEGGNDTPVNTNSPNNDTPPNNGNNTPVNTNPPSNDKPLGELNFFVNIGEYEDEVPVNIAATYLRLTKRGIKATDMGSYTRYSIGSADNYEEASTLKEEMVSLGISDAKVMVTEDGKEGELDEILKRLEK